MNIVVSRAMVKKYNDVIKFSSFIVVQGRVERDGPAMNVVGTRFREMRVAERLSHEIHSFR